MFCGKVWCLAPNTHAMHHHSKLPPRVCVVHQLATSILMEATTIRLSNVNFPLNSAVRLNSLKGPLDGKYPNFGSAVSAAQQVGRVNFIKNVSSGGNALNTRQAFDQYGKNITIGKIANP